MARVRIAIPDNHIYTTKLTVRVADLNYGAHLSNVAILGYAHEVRVEWLSSMGYTELDVEGAGIIQSDAEIVYRGQAYLGDILKVNLYLSEWTGRGFELIYQIVHEKKATEIGRLKTGLVFFDYRTQSLATIPEAFKKKLSTIHEN